MADYDTIFIGSGHATWHAAVTLARAQQKVAIIEEDTIAGTCTNFGCDAKILLDGPFELTEQLKQNTRGLVSTQRPVSIGHS